MRRLTWRGVARAAGIGPLLRCCLAQDDDSDDDDSFFSRSMDRPLIAAGETVDAALIINGDITVDGDRH